MIKSENKIESNKPVLFFDGVCNLCTGSVQFIFKRDSKEQFLFASLQSDYAKKTLGPIEYDSIILLKDNTFYNRSNAALEIARHLDGAWPVFYLFKIVPKFIRDAIYDWIARNRYKWLGKKTECWIPTPEIKARFVG